MLSFPRAGVREEVFRVLLDTAHPLLPGPSVSGLGVECEWVGWERQAQKVQKPVLGLPRLIHDIPAVPLSEGTKWAGDTATRIG